MIEFAYHSILSDYKITWRLTSWCNFRCEYCQQKKEDKTSFDILVLRAYKIAELIDKIDDTISLDLTGGEIMFYDVAELLEILYRDKIKSIHITSDFSGPIENFKKIVDFAQSKNVLITICCSFHETQFIMDRFLDKYEELVSYIIEKGCSNTVHIHIESVETENNKNIMDELRDRCEEEGFDVNIDKCRISGSVNLDNIQDKDLKYNILGINTFTQKYNYLIKKDGFIYTCSDKNTFYKLQENLITNGYYCSGPMKQLFIFGDEIYSIKCKLRRRIGYLGTLNNDINTFKFEPLLCVSDRPCTLCGYVGYDNNKERLIRTIKNKRVFLD